MVATLETNANSLAETPYHCGRERAARLADRQCPSWTELLAAQRRFKILGQFWAGEGLHHPNALLELAI
jgi:hypothetical protein